MSTISTRVRTETFVSPDYKISMRDRPGDMSYCDADNMKKLKVQIKERLAERREISRTKLFK